MKRFAVSENSYTFPTIEAGKRYEVLDWDQTEPNFAYFDIETTSGVGQPFKANCHAFGPCAFLDGATWTIIEEEDETNG